MSAAAPELPGPLLAEVSRSFSLTLRVLPKAVRFQIGLAYLLARTSDTIADTTLIPPAQRVESLRQFRACILGTRTDAMDFAGLAAGQSTPSEKILLQRTPETLALLTALSPDDLKLVREVLDTITRGQELDLERFGNGDRLVALANAADLDAYTFAVAGCVGEFWTKMTLAHCFTALPCPASFVEDGVQFGKGLQLVNVLRDLPRDLRNGRCYLPLDELAQAGLQPEELLAHENWPRLRPVYNTWLAKAQAHLSAGARYTLAIPSGQYRLRLACAWPLLMGQETLALLHRANPLQPEPRLKISRAQVRGILWRTIWRLPFRNTWEKLFTQA
ncbi:MAG: squalene/phytoene synthase family protein [Pedosphaera sp.]|nr:squalene/phytoene synthase family protein [Pedosphaera sp.]MSU43096.1 squalene/phytoene synthase family protein [Pedosphaera sp.]